MENINQLVKELKQNIEALVNNNKIEEAETLIDAYQKLVPDDQDIYSIKAVISIIKGNLELAEEIIYNGLKMNDENFDLLYNLAYLFEQKQEYNKAIIYYKRARKLKNFELTIRTEIDNNINKIIKEQEDKLKIEYEEYKTYKYLAKIQNVLFIDSNLSTKVNNLAKSIDGYGINIDLAYYGQRPDLLFTDKELKYRKILALTNIDDLIDYINNYAYDIIQLFNIPEDIGTYLKHGCKVPVLINNNLLNRDIDFIFERYFKKLKEKQIRINAENGEDLTILIPSYNRPDTLKRTINYFNSMKKINPNIIILDSSSDVNKKINEKTISDLNNNKILYYPFDSAIHIVPKSTYGLELVKTPYVAVCADDDFLTEEGLIKSLEVLKKDSTVYSVKGRNLFFTNHISNLQEHDYFFQGLNEENIIDRLNSYVTSFACTLQYQVFKIDEIKKLYLFITEHIDEVPSNITFGEYCFYFLTIITGKIGKINVDLNIRDKGIKREFYVQNFPHAVLEGNFNENYKMFIAFTCKYCKELGIVDADLDKKIQSAFISFLINFLKIPPENIVLKDNLFDLIQLEIGMKKSWVWPGNL